MEINNKKVEWNDIILSICGVEIPIIPIEYKRDNEYFKFEKEYSGTIDIGDRSFFAEIERLHFTDDRCNVNMYIDNDFYEIYKLSYEEALRLITNIQYNLHLIGKIYLKHEFVFRFLYRDRHPETHESLDGE